LYRQVSVFIDADDERSLSESIRAAYPEVAFLDGNIWQSPEPKQVPSIDHCASPRCFIWNRSIVPKIDTMLRHDGLYQGPASAKVIEFSRSRLRVPADIPGSSWVTEFANTPQLWLCSGRLATSLDDVLNREMIPFAKNLWNLCRRFGRRELACVSPVSGEVLNPRVTGCLVGPHAAAWCSFAEGHFLRDYSVANWYLPINKASPRIGKV
jgi:hypothetical protein